MSQKSQHQHSYQELLWRKTLALASLSLIVLLLIFWNTFSLIVATWWRAGAYTHGFLVIPIVAYLIWQRRIHLAGMEPKPAAWVAVILLCLSLIWFGGYEIEVLSIQFLAVVAMIPTLLWLVFGTRILTSLAFPLCYLFFAAPVGDFLVPPMQDFTAAFSVQALQLSGIPVFWEGRFFHIPSGTFEVAEACSGVRYLIASLALGTLYAYLTYRSLLRRAIFIILSIFMPIVANGLRAYGIVMLAHLSDYKLAVGLDHLIYGWIFFGVVIGLMFWVGALFREPDLETTSNEEKQENVIVPDLLNRQVALGKWGIPLVVALLVTISGPLAAAWLDTDVGQQELQTVNLPAGTDGWQGPATIDNSLGMVYYGATSMLLGRYSKDGQSVDVYIASYSSQSQGKELINIQNTLYDRKAWRRNSEQVNAVVLANGTEHHIHTMVVSSENMTRLLWYWYSVGDHITNHPYMVKLYELHTRLFGIKAPSSVIVLSVDYDIDMEQVQNTLKSFISSMLPAIQEMLVGDT